MKSTHAPLAYRRLMRESVRLYFAPLTGALKGIRSEWRRLEQEAARQRADEHQDKARH